MTTEETLAQQIAGDNYGLSLEADFSRQYHKGRLFPDERKAFDAGWEAARQYYANEPKVADVQG